MQVKHKVFGIGLNKTGTKTLGECMHLLGMNNKSYDPDLLTSYSKGDIDKILKLSALYDSFEDWPWPLLFRELDNHYPDAKFILTTRVGEETWYQSLCSHAEKTGPTEARKIVYGHLMPMDNPAHHKNFYSSFNQTVRNYFSSRQHKLLIVCWERGDGWREICSFLNLPIPDIPFPHLNKSFK